MAEYDYDLFTIGAGSGGVRASRVAAGHGARVAVAEDHRVGGTCVIRGCVPKKLLTYAAHFRQDFEDAAGYGWTVGEPTFSWPALIEAKDREIARLEGIYRSLLSQSGVTCVDGRAVVVDPHTVEVGGRRITARHVLVATGGWPVRPDFPGAQWCITSNEAFALPELPRRVLIVGGGYIAVEFAGIFRGLGSTVTLAYRGDQVLRGFDDDVRAHLAGELVKHGIDLRLHAAPESIERLADGTLRATLRTAAGLEPHDVDAVMLATGRAPATRGLGLAEAGVALDEEGGVVVDDHGTSSVPSIHAVGDVTNRVALTPVAIREGAALSATLFGQRPTTVDHATIPHAVFSDPPIGAVGLTEGQARAISDAVTVHKASFRPLKATLSGREQKTLMKLVVDADTQRVLGAHMVGPDAPEIIQGIAIAVKARLTKAQFDETVAIHPTAAEEFVTMR
ncbi:MAG TPA: glutathione-disulfide reductase [Burkholderiaceae bacterium]|nr:glutathione-disulfide reductase [Burkholderiaceae bacterium]